jgi:hypothetical protein
MREIYFPSSFFAAAATASGVIPNFSKQTLTNPWFFVLLAENLSCRTFHFLNYLNASPAYFLIRLKIRKNASKGIF